MNICIALAVVILFSVVRSYAIVVAGDQDNSIMPSEERGQSSVGNFDADYPVTGVVVSSNYFLAGNHVGGSVGSTFTIGGTTYTTIAKTNDPDHLDIYGNPDLDGNTLWKIGGCFPTNRIAKFYTNSLGIGKTVTVFGRGTAKGIPIYKNSPRPMITNFVKGDSLIEFEVVGGGVGAKFAVWCATNITGSWTTLPGIYTIPGNQSTNISIPTTANPNMFFRTVITEPVLIGWNIGTWDGVMRWGTNVIIGAETNTSGNYSLYSTFDRDGGDMESCATGGDSSGAVFVKDSGKWKLIGIILGGDRVISYSFDGSDNVFAGTLFDVSGLYMWGNPYPLPTDYGAIPHRSTYSPIPVSWVNDLIQRKW